jgi:hypothetical protein
MTKDSIEFSWQGVNNSQNIVIVSILSDDDLIMLCDKIYHYQKKFYPKVNIFFFRNTENASHFIYMRAIKDIDEQTAISNSYCTAYLIDNVFRTGMNEKRLVKHYDSPLADTV